MSILSGDGQAIRPPDKTCEHYWELKFNWPSCGEVVSSVHNTWFGQAICRHDQIISCVGDFIIKYQQWEITPLLPPENRLNLILAMQQFKLPGEFQPPNALFVSISLLQSYYSGARCLIINCSNYTYPVANKYQ